MCVLDRGQEAALRALAQAEDPHAFMTVATASTVLGEGFAPLQASAPPRRQLRKLAA